MQDSAITFTNAYEPEPCAPASHSISSQVSWKSMKHSTEEKL